MELKEFVAESIIQLIEGVKLAQVHAEDNNALVAPRGNQKEINFGWKPQNIEFDVAVTTTDTAEGTGGAGIFVAALTLGGKVKGEISNQTLSHIKFTIPIYLQPQATSRTKLHLG
ncbi:MAG: hypothetical protein WA109_13700 [Bellilinea sp.]